MKLKKIASLALAGVMAVSMLAGCAGKETGNTNEGDTNVVTPVDNSLAAYLNDEMTDEQKAIVTFSSDATVQAAVEKIAAGMDKATLGTQAGWIPATAATQKTFCEMVEATTADGISYFSDSATKDTTYADLYVVPGNMGETAMKEAVLTALTPYVKTTEMPAVSTSGKYIYSYAGKAAVTKVSSADGQYSAYVIGIVVDQTVTARV